MATDGQGNGAVQLPTSAAVAAAIRLATGAAPQGRCRFRRRTTRSPSWYGSTIPFLAVSSSVSLKPGSSMGPGGRVRLPVSDDPMTRHVSWTERRFELVARNLLPQTYTRSRGARLPGSSLLNTSGRDSTRAGGDW
jgi:hypothetical protein